MDRTLEVAAGSFKTKKPPMIKGTGNVARSLEAALWDYFTTEDFREGQLVGAFYGVAGIPGEWRKVIHQKQEILDMAGQLAEAAGQ